MESITECAKETAYDDLLSQLRVLPFDAVRLAFDSESADASIEAMVSEIQLRPNSAIGIWEQIVSKDLAFVWLWNDI